MIVCIAEKPSVARDLARILGADRPQAGFIEGNGYAVTWTYGHLCTLKEPHDYDRAWKRWDLYSLPMIPPRFGIKLIDIPRYKEQFATIERLVARAEMVINCGDAGQEGELIQQWVLTKAQCKAPIKRLWISSLTDEAIKEGFQNLRDNADMQRLYEAGLARAIGDWLLGINGTRLYTMQYGSPGQMLSIGRVQTPTLALLVERQRAIENFVPTTTFEVQTVYREATFRQVEEPYETKAKAEEIVQSLAQLPLIIERVEKKKGKEYAPRLFDLTSLQVEANKKHGFTAERTLALIQSLYEKKLTTYPRVDTTYLPTDMYPKVVPTLRGLHTYKPLVAPLLSQEPLPKSKKVFDDAKITDHHAIIPTGIPIPQLPPDEACIYDLVARRFIAAFYPPSEVASTNIFAQVGDFPMKATGKQVLTPGWRDIFDNPEEKASDKKLLPDCRKGESGPHAPLVHERTSEPPKYYTEATLLRAMETAGKQVEDEALREALKQNGIGRPSTRAAIIETLFKRGYIRRERNSLRVTDTGIRLIDTINDPMLKSAELTGVWECKLRQIEAGEYAARDFIEELKQLVAALCHQVRTYPYPPEPGRIPSS